MNRHFARDMARLAAVILTIVCACVAAEPVAQFDGVKRIIAVGDVHGDFDRFAQLLRDAGLIDSAQHWIGASAHLVQTGDVLDRWPDSKKAMDLLMRIEKEAAQAGGGVHALIGNHEAMNMLGDLRYVHDGEIASHGGKEAFVKAMSPSGTYGAWILSHSCVIRINDVLFLHGGISPEYATHSIETINRTVREELQASVADKAEFCRNPDGPLWYRGYASENEPEVCALIRPILERYGVRHVVVGHTVSKDGIQARCGGAIVMIDVGLSRAYEGVPACLEIKDNAFRVISGAGRTESLPMGAQAGSP